MKNPCSPHLFPITRLRTIVVCLSALLWNIALPFSAQSLPSSTKSTTEQWNPHRNYACQIKRFRVLTWNVENLFDTLHDEGFHDEEFLPSSPRNWTSRRYWYKQGAIARTLVAAAEMQPIDLIGLCEIENDSVIHHLCRRTRLARLGYEYIVTRSRDQRGVDVALLYQTTSLSLIAHQSLRVPYNVANERPTRDILHVTFRTIIGDTLDVFLAHFPSRLGGAAFSSPYRERTAQLIAHTADSISHIRSHPYLIALGDFNDEPSDPSIVQVLSPYFYPLTTHATAYPPTDLRTSSTGHESSESTFAEGSTQVRQQSSSTFNNNEVKGTYFFRHQWSRIDQILVSPSFISHHRPTTQSQAQKHHFITQPSSDIHIFAPSFLLEYSKTGDLHPRRTYLGTYYHGGTSDHLPLFADFWY